MKAMALQLLCLWILAGHLDVRASEPPPVSASAAGYRFLFVVDASRNVSRQRQEVSDVVCGLLLNGFNGQVRRGDRIGLWTFHSEVFTRQFAPELWAPERSLLLMERAAEFLHALRFEKEVREERVLAAMFEAVRTSGAVTLILIGDGNLEMSGTPFNAAINAVYDQHKQRLRRERKLFVTTLVARDGRIQAWAVQAGGGAIQLPQLPGDLARPSLEDDPQPAPGSDATRSESPDAPPPAKLDLATGAPKPEAASSVPALRPQPASAPAPVTASAPAPPPQWPIRTEPDTAAAVEPKTLPAVKAPEPMPVTPQEAEGGLGREGARVERDRVASPSTPDSSPKTADGGRAAGTPASTPDSTSVPVTPPLAVADGRAPWRLYAGLGLLLAGTVAVGWLLRRGRAPAGPSLISRSLDDPRK